MKNTKKVKPTVSFLEVSTLKLGGTYWNVKNEIVVIKNIDNEKKELKVLNVSDQCHRFIKFANCDLVKQIR